MCNYFECFLERRLYFKALIINLLLTDTETRQHDATETTCKYCNASTAPTTLMREGGGSTLEINKHFAGTRWRKKGSTIEMIKD